MTARRSNAQVCPSAVLGIAIGLAFGNAFRRPLSGRGPAADPLNSARTANSQQCQQRRFLISCSAQSTKTWKSKAAQAKQKGEITCAANSKAR